MKTILYMLFIIAVGYNTMAQITLIPDPRFEKFLIYAGIDSDGIINGQILTSDALSVTKMHIYSVNWNDYEDLIHDITGIESFINLDSLSIEHTMVGGESPEYGNTIDISALVNLKYFHSVENNLSSIDFSNNSLLESIWLYNGGDVIPIDMIEKVDLSNNPNIHRIRVPSATEISLKNGNNNENMIINVNCSSCWWDGAYGYDPNVPTAGSVCIEVDNVESAINSQYPYSEWSVYHDFVGITYTDNLAECILNKPTFSQSNIKIYPNPVSDILYFDTDQEINKVILFDMLGRKMMEQSNTKNISVSDLQKGSYILKLFSDKGVQTEKIIIK